jgi:ABC-type transporter Mla maintaining outer membrane lipid asymmetry ATPase subunit MlaF
MTIPTPPPAAVEAGTPLIALQSVAIGAAETPSTPLAEGVDWRIMRGDFWVVLGPPGSGKSALLATLVGLQRPLAGKLEWFGTDALGLTGAAQLPFRLRLGLVFEHGGRLFHNLTVYENVALPLCYHANCALPDARGPVQGLLEALGLGGWAATTPGRLRPSWRQRVALARALALKPEVLLLDNPTAGLDPAEARWWRETLAQLACGHEAVGGQPLTLVVTCQNLRPWLEPQRQFALLRQTAWQVLGDRAAVTRLHAAGQADWLTSDPDAF